MNTVSNMNTVSFEYLDLGHIGGRGGTLRFFLLAHQIPYQEKLVPMTEWDTEKKRLVESGENPCGTVPVVYMDDDNRQLSQHIAITRYLARVHNLTSGDFWKEYVQDMVADEYQGFRDMWVEKSFTATDAEKEEYRSTTLPDTLTKFEALYRKYKTTEDGSAYLSTSPSGAPLWGDAAMFSLLYDHIQTGHLTVKTLEASYPNLHTLHRAYANIPAVSKWIVGEWMEAIHHR